MAESGTVPGGWESHVRRWLTLGIAVFAAFVALPAGGAPAAAATPAPTSASGFFAAFQAKNDWTWSGGDQVTSLRAPNGLTYWSFGDTIIGEEDPATGAYRPGWQMIANTILVQRGGEFGPTTSAVSGRSEAQPAVKRPESLGTQSASVPNAADGDRYWTQGMFTTGGKLYVLCQRVRNAGDWFELRGVELARFGFNADGTLAFEGMLATPSTGKVGGNSVATAQYSADAVVTGGYVYIFGFANAPDDPFAPHRSYVARVPTGSVASAAAWRFYAGGAWSADMAAASPIVDAQLSSVRLVGGQWIMAYKPWNGWGDTVYIERRPTPYAAPSGTVTVSSSAGVTPGGQRYVTYSAQLHPEQALASGKLLLSIAFNGETLGDTAADADLYKPRFYEITLP